ncbi:penicillin-binding protein 2 [Nafulsella turpanensis]|uniref:penicillin-binding protein 2 n=1 Tax=Nafulsella turpanensis TaxID=1265690 RepID=UPI0003453AE0|nr:penicillin-binding protein 2 [Nafulsella turpanensis]
MNDSRKFVIGIVFLLVGGIFLAKLFAIQVLDGNYKSAAESNITKKIEEYPYRGLIYDRNGNLIVYNKPVYDLMVVPKEAQNTDTSRFVQLFKITEEEFAAKMQKARSYSYAKPSAFLKQMSAEEFASVQDHLVDFPGFFITPRTVRAYPSPVMASALGYVAEINDQKLARDTTRYYKAGDYIGISGIEAMYEPYLQGKRGVRLKTVNVRGIVKGDYKDGEYDTLSVPGKNLVSTVDIRLQEYGEYLMKGKSGSIVAIQPATGEVLSIISGPTYDPNLLSGRELGKNFAALQADTLIPLFNRPIMAQYPPGSMFKLVQGLVGLQEGVIEPHSRFQCNRALIACHGPHSNEDLKGAIKVSCNPYFYNTFRRIINQEVSSNTFADSKAGMQLWADYIERFGLGHQLKIDLPGEKAGNVPKASYYDRVYGEGRWKFSNIFSLAIGQGELGVTPLQMANLAAIIANRGHFYTPHLVKKIGDGEKLKEYQVKHETGVAPEHYSIVVDAMEEVVQNGTGQYRAKIKDIAVCGKTSTVQNPHGEDHSGFIAFAPKDNPQIAVAVYVENAGQGARAAAAIASLVIEKYLKGEIERKNIEDYVLKGKFVY